MAAAEEMKKPGASVCLASGLCYVDVHVGEGEAVQTGDIVIAQIRGYTKGRRYASYRLADG